MTLKIISIGKKHESWVCDGIERYHKRLKRPFDVEWVILPHSSQNDVTARQEESGRILLRLDDSDYVILLDEKGKNINSPTLSEFISNQLNNSKRIVFIIGGAYGVDERVINRADFVWSLSRLVFPHQLVRLILIEQIYRAQEIFSNKPYHHN